MTKKTINKQKIETIDSIVSKVYKLLNKATNYVGTEYCIEIGNKMKQRNIDIPLDNYKHNEKILGTYGSYIYELIYTGDINSNFMRQMYINYKNQIDLIIKKRTIMMERVLPEIRKLMNDLINYCENTTDDLYECSFYSSRWKDGLKFSNDEIIDTYLLISYITGKKSNMYNKKISDNITPGYFDKFIFNY